MSDSDATFGGDDATVDVTVDDPTTQGSDDLADDPTTDGAALNGTDVNGTNGTNGTKRTKKIKRSRAQNPHYSQLHTFLNWLECLKRNGESQFAQWMDKDFLLVMFMTSSPFNLQASPLHIL